MFEAGLFLIVICVAFFKSIVVVQQGYEYTVERLGRCTKTLKPGIHFLIPLVELVGAKFKTKEVIDIVLQNTTKDNKVVCIDAVLKYQIQDVYKAASYKGDLKLDILNLAITNIRSMIKEMDMSELKSKWHDVNRELLSLVEKETMSWGIQVTHIEMKDLI